MLRDKREDAASENQGQTVFVKKNNSRNKKYIRRKQRKRKKERDKILTELENKFRQISQKVGQMGKERKTVSLISE